MLKEVSKEKRWYRGKGIKGALKTTFVCFTMTPSATGAVQVLAWILCSLLGQGTLSDNACKAA